MPSFKADGISAVAYGTAVHAVLQYLRYEACTSVQGVQVEVERLINAGFLSQQQGEMVNCGQIAAFFETEIGQKLAAGVPYLREFKFSILDDGYRYGEDLAGEQVLLQGVVDCALLEEDGITVLDFKTDYVTEESISSVAAGYRAQVETYAEALSRIYEMPVKAKLLYFFRLKQFVEV